MTFSNYGEGGPELLEDRQELEFLADLKGVESYQLLAVGSTATVWVVEIKSGEKYLLQISG